jgi:hypothetical protein
MKRIEACEAEMTNEAQIPTTMVWSETDRQSRESQMDSETSVYLRIYLDEDFSKATSWDDLICRLKAKGFHLKFDQNRLTLVNEHTCVHLCTCRFLGFGFDRLALILGKPRVHAKTNRLISSDLSA